MDVAFEGKHFVCEENAGTCRLMEERFEFRGRKRKKGTTIRTDLATVQVDGNGWSGRSFQETSHQQHSYTQGIHHPCMLSGARSRGAKHGFSSQPIR